MRIARFHNEKLIGSRLQNFRFEEFPSDIGPFRSNFGALRDDLGNAGLTNLFREFTMGQRHINPGDCPLAGIFSQKNYSDRH